MTIVAIITSVNYADYLRYCLMALNGVADQVLVVTEADDASEAVAGSFHAGTVLFDGWQQDGASFNKSGGVRAGQQVAYERYPDAWYLLIDADIMLPVGAREIIDGGVADPEAVYGARRRDYHTQAELIANTPTSVYASPFAGYFQLYRRHVLYPEWSRSAEGCDLAFAQQFAACRMLPITVAHCGQEAVNWTGRRSPLWP